MGYAGGGYAPFGGGINESSLWGIMLVLDSVGSGWSGVGLHTGTRRDRTCRWKKLAPEITV